MKLQLLLVAITLIAPMNGHANGCRMVDYSDHIELICTGPHQVGQRSEPSTAYVRRVAQQIIREVPQATTVNSCKMLQANHYDVARNSTVEVELSCSIVRPEAGPVEFLLNGLNGNKELLFTALMDGYVDDYDTDIKKTIAVDFGKFINIRRWEPDTTGRKIVLAEAYIYNERETGTRIAQINKAVETREREDAAASLSSVDDIRLAASMGSVLFRHSTHTSQDCSACHIGSSPGRIAGIGKDWAHRTCKGCHAEIKRGPTACKECHKK